MLIVYCHCQWAIGTLDDPDLMDPPELSPPFESMHCRARPVNGQVSSFPVYKVSHPFFYLHLQPLHHPLLQMRSPYFSSQGFPPHFRPQCLLIQRHNRCICQRVAAPNCASAVRPNSSPRPCFLQHPHLRLC